jgi:hypothetical protein
VLSVSWSSLRLTGTPLRRKDPKGEQGGAGPWAPSFGQSRTEVRDESAVCRTTVSRHRDTQYSSVLQGARGEQCAIPLLAYPISGTVLASWPTSSRFKRLGRHSSSRTRTGEQGLLGLLQRGDGLVPADRPEIVKKLWQWAGFEVSQAASGKHLTRGDSAIRGPGGRSRRACSSTL